MNKIVMFVSCLMLFSVGPVFSETAGTGYDSGEFSIPKSRNTRVQPPDLTFLGATSVTENLLAASTGVLVSERDGILYDIEVSLSSTYLTLGTYVVCTDSDIANVTATGNETVLFAPLMAGSSSFRMSLMDSSDGNFVPRTFRHGLNCWATALFEFITFVFREGS